MFRYEINSVFNKHLFQGEDNRELFLLGQKPLSQYYEGMLIKEKVAALTKQKESIRANKLDDTKKQYDEQVRKVMEVFVPPGVVKVEKTFDRESKTTSDIRNAMPGDMIAIRKKVESRSSIRGNQPTKPAYDRESKQLTKNLSKVSGGGKKEDNNKQRDTEARARALMEV